MRVPFHRIVSYFGVATGLTLFVNGMLAFAGFATSLEVLFSAMFTFLASCWIYTELRNQWEHPFLRYAMIVWTLLVGLYPFMPPIFASLLGERVDWSDWFPRLMCFVAMPLWFAYEAARRARDSAVAYEAAELNRVYPDDEFQSHAAELDDERYQFMDDVTSEEMDEFNAEREKILGPTSKFITR